MKTKIQASVIASSLLAFSTQPSHAWFFFFFPIPSFGSSTSSDPNEKCISEKARVGLLINFEGSVYRVKSIMGRSSKCTTDRLPILALTERIAIEPRAPQARLNLTEGWQEKPLTDALKQRNVIGFATNPTLDIGAQLSSADARFLVDFQAYVRHYYEASKPEMPDRVVSQLRSTNIAGLSAYQWETAGTVNGKQITYLNTYILGRLEVVCISTWTLTANFQKNKQAMVRITNSVQGIRGGYQPKQSLETSHSTGKKEITRTEAAPAEIAKRPNGGGAVDKLQDLKKMFDGGLITADEYGAKKKQILDGM